MSRPLVLIQLLVALAALAASAPGLTTPARGDTVTVRKTAKPVMARTTFINNNYESEFSCIPAICFSPWGTAPDLPSNMRKGRVVVGYVHWYDVGTGICPCEAGGITASRGMVLFKTDDIPHHFKSATLVLLAEDDNVDPSVLAALPPFFGIFETPPGRNVFSRADVVQFYPPDGIVTSVEDRTKDQLDPFGPAGVDPELQLNNAVAFPFPFPPYPNGAVLERTNQFDFRIDVTKSVGGWVADWLHRNDSPFHGFILVGRDERTEVHEGESLQITYTAYLEFEIDEPDR